MGNKLAPLYVIQALAAVREGGEVNMLDRRGVSALSPSAKASAWIDKASGAEYMDALNDMGRYISNEIEFEDVLANAPTDDDESEDEDTNGNYSY